MKNLTWQNPEQLFVAQELINKVKSKCCGIKGRKLLEGSQMNISQISYQVGLSPKQFAKFFKEEFGYLPSEYKKKEEK